ncbi:MAG: hypothetical protein K2G90_04175 [Muribaculaceae bacterium]|nr:hypothetical protein [Muribaculaceae bacterium]
MKKISFLLCALVTSLMVNAQTPSDSIKEAFNKISDLENRITLQDTRIAQLLQQVDEVTRQNLALKKNLNLSPTIATAKAGDIMEYRIIEVTGDPETNTVHMVMIADDISGEDKYIKYAYYQVVDDQGHGYENSLTNERFVMKVDGESNQLAGHGLQHHPNAPYTIDIYLNDCNPDVQYIKYFSMEITDSSKHHTAIFENLPIKWNK